MAGCPEIGGVEGEIGGEMAGAAVVGGDGAAGKMAGDWRGRGRDWQGDGVAGRGSDGGGARGWRGAGAGARRGGGARGRQSGGGVAAQRGGAPALVGLR
jgi:hypothetical protein